MDWNHNECNNNGNNDLMLLAMIRVTLNYFSSFLSFSEGKLLFGKSSTKPGGRLLLEDIQTENLDLILKRTKIISQNVIYGK